MFLRFGRSSWTGGDDDGDKGGDDATESGWGGSFNVDGLFVLFVLFVLLCGRV